MAVDTQKLKKTCLLYSQSLLPLTLAYYNSSTLNSWPSISNNSSVFLRPVSSPAIRTFFSKTGAMSLLPSLQNPHSISYLTQREAAEVDETLMGPLGFSVDQLMELAGLSVAASIAEVYKPSEYNRVLAICGPGKCGGDGLVASRHLHQFGYKPFVCYPSVRQSHFILVWLRRHPKATFRRSNSETGLLA